MAEAIHRKCSANLRHISTYAGLAKASSVAISNMFREKSPHPGAAVGLLQVAAGRQRRAAVEDADVVEPQKTALEGIVAGAVLAVHPPGKVESQSESPRPRWSRSRP
jgi:hypothetical protein